MLQLSSNGKYSRVQNEGGKEEEAEQKSVGQKIMENVGSGITVSLVSIPLSTALAIASGCTPMMGLSAAIYGPAVGGIVGGSNYNILGPAGALVNILNKLAIENGREIIPWVAFCAGVLSLMVWALKLEKYCVLIPNSVLEGFSFGVAITIGLGQLNFAMGIINAAPSKQFYMNVLWSLQHVGDLVSVEFLPFFVFFVALFSLMKFLPGRPWIILIAILGVIYGFITKTYLENLKPTLLMDKYPEMAGVKTTGDDLATP
jgi:sulfate permease, SulP family